MIENDKDAMKKNKNKKKKKKRGRGGGGERERVGLIVLKEWVSPNPFICEELGAFKWKSQVSVEAPSASPYPTGERESVQTNSPVKDQTS